MVIPFMNLNSSLNDFKVEALTKLEYLMDNSQFIGGEEVELFEEEFAAYCHTRYAVGCSNGTDALVICLKALGIGPGDTVLVPVNTFIATAEAVTMAGANVDFIDVDPETYTINLTLLKEYLNTHGEKNIKAVIPVHLYGQMVNMLELKKIAATFGLKIIEDAAQAHGATFNGTSPGHFSELAAFSFYPGKNLGAFGDAGAIVTNSEELYVKCKMLSNHGRWLEKYKHTIEGYNKRLDSIQAAVLRIKLKYLDNWLVKRQEKVAAYLSQLKENFEIILPETAPLNRHAWHLFVIRVKPRDNVRMKLKQRNIDTGIHYPIPLHLQPAYQYKKYKMGDFRIAEQLAAEILSLPLWPEISLEQINYICDALMNIS